MNTNEIHRGDIFFSDLNPVKGSEQGGVRPVLVIQNNTGNHFSPTVIIAPITSQLKKNSLPTHVTLPTGNGLPEQSMVLLEQIRTVDRNRIGQYISTVDDETMAAIDAAICVSLALEPVKERRRTDDLLLCLCPSCVSSFFQSREYRIKRADPLSPVKSTCDYCNVRTGFDYVITRRSTHRTDGH